jgi:hypothetical protein
VLAENGSKAAYFRISVERENLIPQWPSQMLLVTSFHQWLSSKGRNIALEFAEGFPNSARVIVTDPGG